MHATQLDMILSRVEAKYQVEVVPLTIGPRTIKVLQIKDFESFIERLVDEEKPDILSLPFWAKVWESSFVLAYYLMKQPVKPRSHLLEIGAGLGVVGVCAAMEGHRVTISDVNEDALLFAQANVLLNGCTTAEVRRLDWNDAELTSTYDVIFGSEVVYERRSYGELVAFLDRALSPGGIIYLAKNTELNTPLFFRQLVKRFKFKEKVIRLRSEDGEQRVSIYAIRRKNGSL